MERLKKLRGFAWVLVLAMMLNSLSIPFTTLAAETELSTETDMQTEPQSEPAKEEETQLGEEPKVWEEAETMAETKPESEAETSETGKTQETKAAEKGTAREGEIFTPKQYEGTDLPTDISVVREEDESPKIGYYTYDSQNAGEKVVIVYGTYAAAEAVDPAAKWYQVKADGNPDTENLYQTEDILLQYINISVNGFTEIALEEEKPDFYGGPDQKEGWGGERYVYSFSDKDDADRTYYRVHGSYDGVESFYECDENGNVAYPTPAKADLEADKDRAPAEKVIAPELVDDAAYISKLDVVSIIDGTQDWDDDDDPGNDSNASNKLVRSFDTVIYELEYITSLQNDNYAGFENGQIYVRFELDADSSEAEFDTQPMSWLNEPVVTYRAGGVEYSTVEEARAAGGTITQVLGGYRQLDKPDDLPAVIPGTGTLSAVVKVKSMANGEELQPRFILWCKGNEGDPEAVNEKGNPEAKKAEAEKVKVSAAPKYNIRLTKNSNTSLMSEFDFSTGIAGTVNSNKGTVTGRVFGYNITVQLYNDSATKGLKGIELPQGKITMEVEMKFEASLLGEDKYQDITHKTFTAGDGDELNYYDNQGKNYTPMPLLWDYKLAGMNLTGNMGRQMQWNENSYTTAPRDSTVAGKNGGRQACYDGGTWSAAQNGSKLTFEVDGYQFADTLERGVTLPSQYYGTTNPETISYAANIGCFSAMSFQVIQPMVGGTDLKQNMDFRLTLENTDMKANSVTGQDMGEQQKKDDDKESRAVLLKMPGSYDKQIWYRMVGSAGKGPTSTGTGDAWSSLGNKVRFDTKVVIGTSNDPEDYAYAQNILVKFNDKVLEVDAGQDSASFTKASESPGGNKLDYSILYVGRIGGWDDESQILTVREDDPSLIYFENIDALNAAGYTCVAFLVEGRGDGKDKINIPGKHGVYTPTLTVKETATPGYVAPAVNDAIVWAKDQYEANGNKIPSRLEVGSGSVMPAARSSMNSSTSSGYNYVKSVYDETGWSGGHSGSYTAGNSLLIVGSKAYINKEVAQLTSGTPKDAFDMGANQRIVDYVLTPQIEVAGGSGVGAAKTTVTITDTLPKGLSYLPDSSYLGGTYEPNANPNKQGTVTGGESLEPDTAHVASDGTTTIIWVLEDITPGEPIPEIHFSCIIGDLSDPENDVTNGQQLVNQVGISIPEDTRVQTLANGNLATAGISVIKLKAAALVKMVNPSIYEVGETIYYQLQYSNTGENEIKGIRLLDVLPYKEDGRGTNYKGSYLLANNLTLKGSGTGDMEVYYTTSTAVRGKTALNYSISDIESGQEGWTKAAAAGSGAGNDYTYTIPAGTDVTGIIMVGNMPKQSTISLEIPLEVEGNAPGNIYGNDATMVIADSDTNIEAPFVQARVANRTISGLIWNDSASVDGKRSKGEPLMEGITVRLLEKQDDGTYAPAIDVLGDPVADVLTGEDGAYLFTNLSGGDYQVVILGSSQVNLAAYSLTIQKASGVPSSVNSDAEAVLNEYDVLTQAVIRDIKLPALADMKTYQYAIINQDAGLYQNDPGSMTVYKVDAVGPETKLGEMQFILYRIQRETMVYYSLNEAKEIVWTENESDAQVFETTVSGRLKLIGEDQTISRIEDLDWGTYYIEEKKAPYGYEMLEDPVAVNINENTKHVTVSVEDTRKTGSILLEKTDAEDTDVKLEGVTFILYREEAGKQLYYSIDTNQAVVWSENKNEAQEFVTDVDGKLPVISGLTWDTYYFQEMKTIQGYRMSEEPQKVEINRENAGEVVSITVTNNRITGSINIKKIDAEDEMKSLGGAKFLLYQKDGNKLIYDTGKQNGEGQRIYSESEDEAYLYETGENGIVTISDLAWGTYYVREAQAPNGYVLNEEEQEVTITQENVHETAELTFTNKRIKVQFLKTDEEGNPIAGAKLEIIDTDGNLIEAWISKTTPHVIEGKLKAKTTYTLRETESPEGYLLAPSQTFTTNADDALLEVVMKDKKCSEEYAVKITKYVVCEDKYRSMNYSFYAALFWDEACTERASEVVELKLENAYCTTAEFTRLAEGAYYLAETDADGNVIDVTSADALFTNETDGKMINLNSSQKNAESTIINYIKDPNNDFLLEDDGEIMVNKTVTANGKKAEVTDTFYFTLFADEAKTLIVETKALSLKDAQAGSVTFEMLAYGTYYIAETDAEGNQVGEDFGYEVTLDQDVIQISGSEKEQSVNIRNENLDLEEESEETTETETTKITTKKTTTSPTKITRTANSVKTGDRTLIALYILIMLGAAVTVTGVILARRKHR